MKLKEFSLEKILKPVNHPKLDVDESFPPTCFFRQHEKSLSDVSDTKSSWLLYVYSNRLLRARGLRLRVQDQIVTKWVKIASGCKIANKPQSTPIPFLS